MRRSLALLLALLAPAAAAQRQYLAGTPDERAAVIEASRYIPLASDSIVGGYSFSTGYTGGAMGLYTNGLFTYSTFSDAQSSGPEQDPTPEVWGYYLLSADTLRTQIVGIAQPGGCRAPRTHMAYERLIGLRRTYLMKRVEGQVFAVPANTPADSVHLQAFASDVLEPPPSRTPSMTMRRHPPPTPPYPPRYHAPTEPYIPNAFATEGCNVQTGLPLTVRIDSITSESGGRWGARLTVLRVRGQARDALTGGPVERLEVCRHPLTGRTYCNGIWATELDAEGRFEAYVPDRGAHTRVYVSSPTHREAVVPVARPERP